MERAEQTPQRFEWCSWGRRTLESGTTTNEVARLSGGAGTPTAVPDVLGLALKIPLDPRHRVGSTAGQLRHLGGDTGLPAPRGELGQCPVPQPDALFVERCGHQVGAGRTGRTASGVDVAGRATRIPRGSATEVSARAPLGDRFARSRRTGDADTGARTAGRRATLRPGTPLSTGVGAAPRLARRGAGRCVPGKSPRPRRPVPIGPVAGVPMRVDGRGSPQSLRCADRRR